MIRVKAGTALVRITNLLKALTPEEITWVMTSLQAGSLVGSKEVHVPVHVPVHVVQNRFNGGSSEGGLGGGFEAFWSVFPRKQGKQKALLSYSKLKPDQELQDSLLKALLQQKQWDAWTRENGRFVPMASTWLNQGRWTDEPNGEPTPDMYRRSSKTSGNAAAGRDAVRRIQEAYGDKT